LHDGLSVIVDLPYWHDCPKFSGRGQLAEMQQVVPLAESDLLADRPQIVSRRQALRSYLDFQKLPDPVRSLHSRSFRRSTRCMVRMVGHSSQQIHCQIQPRLASETRTSDVSGFLNTPATTNT
jgi:hypothetical protein